MSSQPPASAAVASPVRLYDEPSTSAATQARLLDAAESLLAERGYAGMSMRALAERAGTSISAAHYHFGSKLALVSAVFVARIEPINTVRIERLDALIAASSPASPRLEDVIDTLVRPSFEAWRASEALGRQTTPHILAQLHADPAARLEELKRRLFTPLIDRYLDVITAILPDREPGSLRIGLQLVIGMMLHVIGGHLEREDLSADASWPIDDETVMRHLVAYAVAGLCTAGEAVPASSGGDRCIAS